MAAPTDANVPPSADGAGPADAGPRCAGNHGPVPVAMDAGYCIDSTEVTAKDYREFVVAKGSDFGGQPAGCAWNTSWTPFAQTPDAVPALGVDWCDAYAYCAWAGKRLCGTVADGGIPAAVQVNTIDDEWFRACSANGTREYPYGATFDGGACEVGTFTAPYAAGTRASCQGGYPGVFDLSGNLWEWSARCEDPAGDAGTACLLRGGSYASMNYGQCSTLSAQHRDRNGENDIGVRCCSDLR